MSEEAFQSGTTEEPLDTEVLVDDEIQGDLSWEATDDEGSNQKSSDKLKQLRAELKEVKQSRDEYLAGWQKAKADYINFKKESEEKTKRITAMVRESCVSDILPALDAFEMAMKGDAWESVDANWRTGIEYIFQQLSKVLDDYGVSVIADTSGGYDSAIHEPFDTQEVSEDQHHQILGLVQKGYRTADRVIRPAKIRLGVTPQEGAQE